jgi:hypothetical protein
MLIHDIEMGFKEVFCHDCKTILARYNAEYFSDLKVTELTRLHHNIHIRSGHSVATRLISDNGN